MALHLPTHGLEPVPRCEPSPYQPISRWHSHSKHFLFGCITCYGYQTWSAKIRVQKYKAVSKFIGQTAEAPSRNSNEWVNKMLLKVSIVKVFGTQIEAQLRKGVNTLWKYKYIHLGLRIPVKLWIWETGGTGFVSCIYVCVCARVCMYKEGRKCFI